MAMLDITSLLCLVAGVSVIALVRGGFGPINERKQAGIVLVVSLVVFGAGIGAARIKQNVDENKVLPDVSVSAGSSGGPPVSRSATNYAPIR